MYRTRRAASAALLAAALATGTVACGTQATSTAAKTAASGTKTAEATPKPTASKDPLAGLTSSQIAARAVTDTESAGSVHVTGTASKSGKEKKLSFDLTVVRGKGCTGSITESKDGFRIVYLGKNVWMLPNQAFKKSISGGNSAMLAFLAGKWLKVKVKSSGFGSVASMCNLSKLLAGFSFPIPGGLIKGSTATINGQRAVKLKDSGDSAYIYVSDAAKPEMIRVVDPGSGEFSFTGYGAPVTITAPPSSKVIDGSKYGL